MRDLIVHNQLYPTNERYNTLCLGEEISEAHWPEIELLLVSYDLASPGPTCYVDWRSLDGPQSSCWCHVDRNSHGWRACALRADHKVFWRMWFRLGTCWSTKLKPVGSISSRFSTIRHLIQLYIREKFLSHRNFKYLMDWYKLFFKLSPLRWQWGREVYVK